MENEPRLIVPAYIETEDKITARDYLAVAGLVLKEIGIMAIDFAKDPRGYIDKWSDDFAQATDEWIERRL